MGGGIGGNFGNTKGSSLDALSNLLTVASLIPGLDTFTNAVSIPVDLARGDYLSAGLSVLGVVPVVGEVGDTAKLAKLGDKAIDTAKAGKTIKNPVLGAKRVGRATAQDAHHAFNDIIDNYVGRAKEFSVKGGDGKTRKLYQLKGSLRGEDGIFEWILEPNKGVTHRRFIPGGKITGKPNSK